MWQKSGLFRYPKYNLQYYDDESQPIGKEIILKSTSKSSSPSLVHKIIIIQLNWN
jgi:hypothetical protein